MAKIEHIKELAFKLKLYNIAKGKIRLNNEMLSNLDYIEEIFNEELNLRYKNHIKQLKKDSKVPSLKYNVNKADDSTKWQIEKLNKLDFIENQENIIITSEKVSGKTSLACDLAHKAMDIGHKTYYIKYYDYIYIMSTKDNDAKSKKVFNIMKNSELIIIDEFLYTSITDTELDLFYKSIMFFNEARSIILISNRNSSDWIEGTTDVHLMKTLIERITHNANIVIL